MPVHFPLAAKILPNMDNGKTDRETDTPGTGKTARTRKRQQNLYGQSMGRKGTQTRERLIRATAELLEKRSLRDVSVSDIATLAGTSSSGFYIYFTDVSEAALAAAQGIEQLTPEIQTMLEQPWTGSDGLAHGSSGQERAAALVEAYVNFSSQHHAILRIRNLAADEGDKRFEEVRHRAVARIHELLEARIKATGNGLDPSAGASAVLALMERIAAIARLPLRRHHSRKSLIAAAAFLIASALTPR